MKAKLDKDLCIGCGLCVSTCPEVFKMEEDKNAEIFEQEYIGRVNNPWSIGQLVTV